MNLKLKFSLFFSLLVTVVLVSCVAVIYLLYAGTRSGDYQNRLWSKAWLSYKQHFNIMGLPESVTEKMERFPAGNIYQPQLTILDSSYKIIYSEPPALNYKPGIELLNKIKQKGEYGFSLNRREVMGVYFKDVKHIIIVSGADMIGRKRLARLRWIMGFVTLGGIVVTGFIAFVYANQATRPLIRMGDQMQKISENNLNERVDAESNYMELNLIAANFNDMLDRLDKAFERQKSFVHHASHELRTPLASMLSQTEAALRRDLTNEEYVKVLHSLKEDQQGMIDLTNSLLAFSQYDRINASNEWGFVRLDEILYDAIASSKKSLPGINVSVEFLTVPEKENYLSVRGSEPLLRSAFSNLIKNAYLYSSDKSINILIEENETATTLLFLNNGDLLSEDEASRLFIPFFRGRNAKGEKGYGLGLSIVKRILDVHKGSVTYGIKDGKNCFTIRFIDHAA
ncbi:ATP-binding protein [Foetidibacter luteolus]|uniref:ATP-binding protein n=1 Tax=Foetidibacter luteolus TaxID=2608880 RepID=UPI00129BF667|nr:ATP-binding protein [Foetidibacter luteolus]